MSQQDINSIAAKLAKARLAGNAKKAHSLKVTKGSLEITKHEKSVPKKLLPLEGTSILVKPNQKSKEPLLSLVGGCLSARSSFFKECKDYAYELSQAGSRVERLSVIVGTIRAIVGDERLPEEDAEFVLRICELMQRLIESKKSPNQSHFTTLQQRIIFFLKGKYAAACVAVVHEFCAEYFDYFVHLANTHPKAQKSATESTNVEACVEDCMSDECDGSGGAAAIAFGGAEHDAVDDACCSGGPVANLDDARSFLKGAVVARGSGSAVACRGRSYVGKPPKQRYVVCVHPDTDTSMVTTQIVSLQTVRGLCLFFVKLEDAQEAARLLGTTLLEGEESEEANWLSYQSFLTAVAKGKKRED
jgi:hypothetical protein